MSSAPIGRKVDALLWLAGGKSNRVAAEAAGVAPSTVAAWKRDPKFAAELDDLKQMYEQKPLDGRAFMERLDEAARRLASRGPVTVEGGAARVQVSIPAGASPERARRLIARGVARAVQASLEAGS